MIFRAFAATVTVCLLTAASPATAQQDDVFFEVPLNLTQLAADLTKVAVTCVVVNQNDTQNAPNLGNASGGFGITFGANNNPLDTPMAGEWGRKKVEVPVAGGQVVTTKIVVVTISDTATWHQAEHYGITLAYVCFLSGYSGRMQGWGPLGMGAPISEVFALSPSPEPITGEFTW